MPKENPFKKLPSGLTTFARKVALALLREYPEFSKDLLELNGDLMTRIPAPSNSKAKYLGIQTNGHDLWIKFGAHGAIYGTDTIKEAIGIVEKLLADKICFVAVTKNRQWVESTLVATDIKPQLETKTGTVWIISWSGKYDRKFSVKARPSIKPAKSAK